MGALGRLSQAPDVTTHEGGFHSTNIKIGSKFWVKRHDKDKPKVIEAIPEGKYTIVVTYSGQDELKIMPTKQSFLYE